jgi:prepilin-type N-terminal cleavage/methylation domain-containing protein
MQKGFTLIETMAALALVMFAILSSCRVVVAALDLSRRAALRFHMIETLDGFRGYLASLPDSAPELAEGAHAQSERCFRIAWRVEAEDAFLKRVRLEVAAAQAALPLLIYRSRFIPEAGR